ncbi:MAG: Ig-like domain-containing protein [Taibaiella sp.]|nr:Ig-like domain-containing protein [Taibaiella sp.]
MKRSFLFLFLASFLGTSGVFAQQNGKVTLSPAPTHRYQDGINYEQDRITVKFRSGNVPSFSTQNGKTVSKFPKLDALNRRYGLQKVVRIDGGGKSNDHIYSLRFGHNVDVKSLVAEYTQLGLFDFAEPDYKNGIYTTTPSDPYFIYQWGSNNNGSFAYAAVSATSGADMDMKHAWDITTGSSSVVVAVIDAGARMGHPEFSGRIWTNTAEIAGNGVDDDANGYVDDRLGWNFSYDTNDPTDDQGHGTNVAGIIGANGNNSVGYAGIDWNCKLMMLKALDSNGSGNTGLTSAAIYYATDNGAKVINMSLGGSGYSSGLQTAINYAYSNGVTCVAAMGNDNTSTPFYPAAMNHIIAVGASRCDDSRATFSNYGSHISVIAPGDVIFGLSYTSDTYYGSGMSGTSQATPHVAGLCALLLAQDGTRTHDAIKGIIEATAEDMVGPSSEDVSGFDNYFGHGRVNAYAALTYAGCSTPTVTGTAAVCAGSTTTLTGSPTGGTWSSGSTSVATIASTGVVTGVSAGTAVITYLITGGCSTTRTVTVNSNPATIGGSSSVCAGSTITLTNGTGGGTWSSSATAVATVGSSTGVVTGVSSGTVTITYLLSTGCKAVKTITVNPAPNAGTISGSSSVCVGSTITLSTSGSGGSWSSSNTSIATVGSTTGVVTGAGGGVVTVSYSVTNGCGTATATKSVTVTALPSAGTISGSSTVCVGANITLSTSGSGGSWTSSSTGIATVGSATGVVNGVSAGNVTISYSATNGCGTSTATKAITVNATPGTPTVSGSSSVCVGSTISLTGSPTGGSWSSTATGTATVGTSGVVTGVAAGVVTISYLVSNSCGSSSTTKSVTVNPLASAGTITGSSVVCAGASITLSDAVSGGTWTSSNSSVATVGSTGIVNGVAGGTVTISYTVTNSCSTATTTKVVTVNPLADPGVISGSSSVCVSGTITLTSSVSGGTWVSSAAAVGTIAGTGVFTGLSEGTTTITYTVTNGCGSQSTTKLITVTSVLDAGTITGSASVCVGSTTTLSNAVTGGSWSSTSTSVATIGSTGIVTGVSAGSVVISYTVSNGCGSASATKALTVNPLADAGTITGSSTVCAGSTITLSNAVSGGSWTSSNGATATVGSTGIVTGVTTGSVTISYTVTNGCGSVSVTKSITVITVPNAGTITGASSVCPSGTITLSNAVSGGSWSSSNASVATVISTGAVTGVATGVATISYTVGNSCGSQSATKTITVNTVPDAGTITGSDTVEVDSVITLSNTVPSGTWLSSATAVATVNSSGIVTGVAEGTTTISYTVTTGCGSATTTKVITVVTVAPCVVLSGTAAVCIGNTTTLSASVGGGTWVSGSTSVATVGSSSGIVTGVANGTTNITYSLPGGCTAIQQVTVGLPPIEGTTNVCIGTTTALSHPISGGVWSVASPYYATVDASTGVVTGVHPGPTTVTYTTSPGCYVTTSIYTSNIVLNITGGLSTCEGATTTLSVPGYPGGTWHIADSATVFINMTTGAMLGIATGTMAITYSYGYCYTSAVATVNPVPASITGGSEVCAGGTLALACSTGGGAWSSSNAAVATVDGSGTVTGVTPGTVVIYYTLGSGCAASKVITIGGMPAAITGTTSLCEGATTTLACTSTGGTWSTSDAATADVLSTTVTGFGTYATISGVAAGGATISYNYTGGCVQTVNVTVASAPAAIGGTLDICVGGTSTLTGSGGGTWSSSNTAVASVGSATGVVSGAAAGTATITYRTGATCYTTAEVTVGVPSAISGAASVCKTFTTTFAHATGGGTWSSSDITVASVDASGVVTGVNAGSATITYNISTGCFAVKTIYVYNNPAAISGTASVCAGANTTLTGATGTAAIWSSSNAGVATVGSSSGVVTGVAAGNADITFTATATGCYSTRTVTVNEAPAPITGASTICVGANETYMSTPTGGAWASTAPAVGSINSTTGTATGRAPGGTYIKYTLSTGCYVLKAVTVTALPGGIAGTSIVCVGNSVVLSAATSGSTWSSSAAGTASITATTSSTATVAGISTGTAMISYSNAAGCSRTYTVTVNAAVSDIVGDDIICSTGTMTLTNATGGGTWSSNATTKVSVATYTGLATGGGTLGTATITYKVGAGCYATKSITNNAALPNIVGATYTCSGADAAVTFTNAVSGGTWSSSNTSVAVVDGSTGVVTGVLLGGSNTYVYITYATSTGCSKYKAILIKPQPIITGADEVSVGATTTMTGSPAGGTWGSSSLSTAYITGYGVVYGIAAGSATISYTTAGCVNTKEITVTGGEASRPAGMTEEAETLFSVFPNPSHGSLSVSTRVAGTFTIYAVDGKVAATSELTAGVNAISLPMNMAAGTYLCRFNGVDGSVQGVRLVYEQ